jgi:flagellar motility protein MotE (MotC chaperone)
LALYRTDYVNDPGMTREAPLKRKYFFQIPCWGIAILASLFVLTPSIGISADAGLIKDPMLLLKSLEERRKDFDDREEKLAIREQDLQRLEEKLAKRIKSLEVLRDVIQRDLGKEKEIDTANIARLAKIYGSMKVKAAAAGLQSIDQDIAVKVLKVMSEKTAGKILGKMKGGNAVVLANELGMSIAEKRK